MFKTDVEISVMIFKAALANNMPASIIALHCINEQDYKELQNGTMTQEILNLQINIRKNSLI
jgi:hypothetical protein